MRKLKGMVWLLLAALAISSWCAAQDENADMSLGDLARSLRKKTASQQPVIDNDNFTKLMEEAANRRQGGASLLFSLDAGANGYRVSPSPGVTCSLSFSANSTALLAEPVAPEQLPANELAKLDGPATLEGDSLQVSIHNGTQWELREVIIGLTIIKHAEPGGEPFDTSAKLFPAVAGSVVVPLVESTQKAPDATILLRIKGSAAPSATAIFRTALTSAISPDQNWRWSILRAKGIPPQAPTDTASAQSAQETGQQAPPEQGKPVPSSAQLPGNRDAESH